MSHLCRSERASNRITERDRVDSGDLLPGGEAQAHPDGHDESWLEQAEAEAEIAAEWEREMGEGEV